MNQSLPAAVLFDLDGTLIDTYRLYLECYQRALEPFLGRRPGVDDLAAREPSSELGFLTDWLGEEKALECHASVRRHYRALHGALCDGVYEGAREMLDALRSAGCAVGIVTGKARHAWDVTREALDLGPFAVVVTEDDVDAPKPHPGGLLAAAEALAVEPAAAVYVGDSASDMAAGRMAGMRVAAALWAKTAPGEADAFMARVRRWNPDWAFARPAELTRAFAPWC